MEAQAPLANAARSCSMPLARNHNSPSAVRGAQQGWMPPHADAGAATGQGNWLAAEQLRLSTPGRQQGMLESIDEPEEDGLLPLG